MNRTTTPQMPDKRTTADVARQRWFYDRRTRTIRDENGLTVATLGPTGDVDDDGKVAAAAPQLLGAALVFCTDRRIRAWLEKHDPKALHQARLALVAARIGDEDGVDVQEEHHHG